MKPLPIIDVYCFMGLPKSNQQLQPAFILVPLFPPGKNEERREV
jgi:hypothetical protein